MTSVVSPTLIVYVPPGVVSKFSVHTVLPAIPEYKYWDEPCLPPGLNNPYRIGPETHTAFTLITFGGSVNV
jgi:hypothetical protein